MDLEPHLTFRVESSQRLKETNKRPTKLNLNLHAALDKGMQPLTNATKNSTQVVTSVLRPPTQKW